MAAAIVANGVEPFAESGPDIGPLGCVLEAVLDEDDGVGTSAAFFVVDLPGFDIYECPRCRLRGGRCLLRRCLAPCVQAQAERRQKRKCAGDSHLVASGVRCGKSITLAARRKWSREEIGRAHV